MRRALRKLLTTRCCVSGLLTRVALMAEQVLEFNEVLAHGIDVAHKRREVLLRAIEVASQRRHGIAEGLSVLARIATAALQPAAQGAVGNADAIRSAPDAAVTRDRACEELGQRRGRDDDTPRHRAATRGGIAAGAGRVFVR